MVPVTTHRVDGAVEIGVPAVRRARRGVEGGGAVPRRRARVHGREGAARVDRRARGGERVHRAVRRSGSNAVAVPVEVENAASRFRVVVPFTCVKAARVHRRARHRQRVDAVVGVRVPAVAAPVVASNAASRSRIGAAVDGREHAARVDGRAGDGERRDGAGDVRVQGQQRRGGRVVRGEPVARAAAGLAEDARADVDRRARDRERGGESVGRLFAAGAQSVARPLSRLNAASDGRRTPTTLWKLPPATTRRAGEPQRQHVAADRPERTRSPSRSWRRSSRCCRVPSCR